MEGSARTTIATRGLAEIPQEIMRAFLATTAHDVRTPLHTLLVFSECLNDGLYGGLNDEQKEVVEGLANASKYLTSLFDNVFSAFTLQQEAVTVVPGEVDTAEALTTVHHALGDYATSKNVTLNYEKIGSSFYASGDRDKVVQILVNMVVYGIKSAAQGTVKVKQSHDDKQWFCSVTVIPGGDGVVPNDPFEEITGDTLNLHIARAIAIAHGGTLTGGLLHLDLSMPTERQTLNCLRI